MKPIVSDKRAFHLAHGGEYAIAERSSPQDYLRALLALATHPRRLEVVWDFESLTWFARVWQAAVIAALGDADLQDRCRIEAERYAFLANKLHREEIESARQRIVTMDKHDDWPHPTTIQRAIGIFDRAGIMSVQ